MVWKTQGDFNTDLRIRGTLLNRKQTFVNTDPDAKINKIFLRGYHDGSICLDFNLILVQSVMDIEMNCYLLYEITV